MLFLLGKMRMDSTYKRRQATGASTGLFLRGVRRAGARLMPLLALRVVAAVAMAGPMMAESRPRSAAVTAARRGTKPLPQGLENEIPLRTKDIPWATPIASASAVPTVE